MAKFTAPSQDRLRSVDHSPICHALPAFLISGLCWVQLLSAAGQGVSSQLGVVRSQSGQFIVRTTSLPSPPRAVLNLTATAGFVQLQPAFLAVSCERIRQALNLKLEVRTPWQGKIYIALYPASTSNDTIYLTSERFSDGWQYQVRLPQVLGRDRFVSAITQVLLMELANRGTPDRTAEIPAWLSDGLSQNMLSSRELQIILSPPSKTENGLPVNSTTVDLQTENPLRQAHLQLMLKAPLSFQELSWPVPDQPEGEAGDRFRASAHLFVKELLGLPDGRGCLRGMIKDLHANLNWQFAFLRAFHATFQRPLDVEKWWALHTVCYTGRNLAQTWAAEESWRKLDEALRQPVEIRPHTNDLPFHGEATLQTVLRDWAPQPRDEAVKAKLVELQAVRLRLLPDMVPLLDEYRRVLDRFLHRTATLQRDMFKAAVDQDAINEALKALDVLDQRRKAALNETPRAQERSS